jgi:hypothetical protein
MTFLGADSSVRETINQTRPIFHHSSTADFADLEEEYVWHHDPHDPSVP